MEQGKYLHVNYHKNPDILEVIFKDNSRSAVDSYLEVVLAYADTIREEKKFDQPVYIIQDISKSGIYPLDYAIEKIEAVLPLVADIPTVYFAYITDNLNERSFIELIKYFQSSRDGDSRKVFKSDERDQILKWFLSHGNS